MPLITTPAGVDVFYETTGDPSGRPLVLLHGGGAQLIGWDERFCELLVAHGFFVVRTDNRDVGLSQATGGPADTAADYDLADMALDVVAVLDHLGIERAHLAGMSMGGYLAQLVAIGHPSRVASLGLMSTSLSSAPEFLVGEHTGEPVTEVPPALDRDAYVEMFVGGQRHYQSPGFPFDAAASAELGGRYYDRAYTPTGLVRQWNALLRGPLERREDMARVTVPTVVIHGRGDQSLHWSAALETARVMPHAELHLYEEMGHDIPVELWPEFAMALERTARKADAHA
ncbi:alpha/beta fold hydrolase [Rathayibacter sp. VKM Ac-2803]|uniref:alpha/beta fold hydrolase n=1 Tax=unclassified Rathayibacter TaxID=2609250 RepID=UPI00135B1E5B|nr:MULTISPECIES: alpha/beta hydrolase [unclassified Rathayibacter]MWV48948.1 alpha/beta fold hydrolase [Rathayibacter sp. VKM Ac-2803]MWV58559.1 alpha/beta fold hydrolase [Rathayibacter sp. VKM Ac-2754]